MGVRKNENTKHTCMYTHKQTWVFLYILLLHIYAYILYLLYIFQIYVNLTLFTSCAYSTHTSYCTNYHKYHEGNEQVQRQRTNYEWWEK